MKTTLVCSATITVGNHRCVRNWDWVSSLPFPHFPCPKLFLSHDPVGKQTTNSSNTSQSQLWLHQQKCFQSLWWWLFLHGNFNALWLIPKQAYLIEWPSKSRIKNSIKPHRVQYILRHFYYATMQKLWKFEALFRPEI